MNTYFLTGTALCWIFLKAVNLDGIEMIRKFAICAFLAAATAPCTARPPYMHHSALRMQVQSCNFLLTDALHGSISTPSQENNFESGGYSATMRVFGSEKSFGFNFLCHSQFKNVNEIAENYGGHFEFVTDKWVPFFPGASADEISRLRKVTKIFSLDSKNGHGFYMIQDETVGEPHRRVRHFSYCLFHETKAICGLGDVKRLADAKSDMLPYALRILKSVEFTDTPAETSKSANP
ncbi:hypothetical protein [Paraburkholderia strydomiana]